MPYSTNESLPSAVKRKIKSAKRRRQWRHVWNSEYAAHGDEGRAFASAWSQVQKVKGLTMEDNFNFFLPLSKIDPKTRTVSGYASTPALDLDGEIVSIEAIKKALPGYWEYRNIREMHTNSAVGVGKEANIDGKGLFLTAKIVDDEAWKKCVEGVYKGFSIGGRKLNKSGNTITEIDWIETSIVDRPANPECKFEVAKRAKGAQAAYLVKMRSPRSVEQKALSKMAQVVEMLSDGIEKAGPPAAPDGLSLPAKPAIAAPTLCKKHGLENCAKCAMKMAKREIKQKKREALAAQGKALPGGGFPIENKSDLMNARHAIGRAKNPKAARALIRRRAQELGVKLPPDWSKKLAKSLIGQAEAKFLNLNKTVSDDWSMSAQPSFLTLSADGGGGVWSGHELDSGQLSLQKGGTIGKRMSSAGQLAYCFDTIRDAQRSLIREARAEGGDKRDAQLAKTLGSIAKELAAVIGQKAEHEGGEALDLSDVDDYGLELEDLSMSAKTDTLEKVISMLTKRGAPSRFDRMNAARGNLKKARKVREEAEDAIKMAHKMLKSAYLAKKAAVDDLAKAGKKPSDNDADDMDTMGKAMSMLNKAYGSVTSMKTFMKAADGQLKKAASAGQKAQSPTTAEGGYYTPPAGVKEMGQTELVTAGPGGGQHGSEPPILGMEQPYPGKVAKKFKGYVSPEMAKLLAEKAAAEAKVEVLEKLPTGPVHGRRPAAFDVRKAMPNDPRANDLLKGVDLTKIGSGNEAAHTSEVGKIIGNMILGGHGKSVFDPNFHGAAGGSNLH